MRMSLMGREWKAARLLAMLLVLAMMAGGFMVGCGSPEPPAEDPEEEPAPVEEPEEEEEEEHVLDLDRDAWGANGVVAAAKPEASEVGVEILQAGGNAVDAAVAVGFALGVLEPNASGIGGGGFMMVSMAGQEPVLLDFRESAPGNATDDMFEVDEDGREVGEASRVGALASGVPGDVHGLLTALERYGTMTPEEVLAPAIRWAEEGVPVTINLESIIQSNFDKISQFDESASIYLKDGLPYELDDVIVLSDLAETLRVIAREGKDGFYKGAVAEAIVSGIQAEGGIITMEDMAGYETKIRQPVTGTYRGYEIIATPPPSSGGTHIIQILNIMENFDMEELGFNTPEYWHVWAEAMRLSFTDRSQYMADTDFVDVPLSGLTNKEYARTLFELIDMDQAMESTEPGDPWPYESGSTSHYSIMDKDGNMVAATRSINYFFGSGFTPPGTGVIMNNHMNDFTLAPGAANSIEPHKRMLSSMTPTMVLKDGEPYMTLGSPGATRIINTVALMISHIIDQGMDMQEAILQPRIHRMHVGDLNVEGRISEEVQAALEAKGHVLEVRNDYDPYFGGVHGVILYEGADELHGGADPRRDGQAVGF